MSVYYNILGQLTCNMTLLVQGVDSEVIQPQTSAFLRTIWPQNHGSCDQNLQVALNRQRESLKRFQSPSGLENFFVISVVSSFHFYQMKKNSKNKIRNILSSWKHFVISWKCLSSCEKHGFKELCFNKEMSKDWLTGVTSSMILKVICATLWIKQELQELCFYSLLYWIKNKIESSEVVSLQHPSCLVFVYVYCLKTRSQWQTLINSANHKH